ncbi:MAG: 4-oxalocrotonate tautomerase family protein [Saccharospirillaceae bacterium]|nr:4-oxalocrotonate tautomerase family protein [Saccharospirillaceae bacterium]MCD8531825.1 4-oxalocrotonate tautomerase family protein [Saccharospirillaceae bacterium]
MPYINIRITDENVSNEQKQALIHGATQLMVDVLNKPPQVTFVVIDEVSTDNWGIGFDQVTEIRKAQSQQ